MNTTKVVNAAIYRQGAIITRRGSVNLQEGSQRIHLKGLSPFLDESSLRLALPGELKGGQVQTEYPDKEQVDAALKELNDRQALLKEQLENLNRQAILWEKNGDFSAKSALSVAEMTEYLEKLPARLEALRGESRRIAEELKSLETEIQKALEEAHKPFVSAEITAPAAGEYPLELRYRDGNIFWNPIYEIHGDSSGEALDLRLRGQIRQGSGEDWEGVSITLYTGNPSLSGTIPQQHSTHIRFYEAPKIMNDGLGRAPRMAMQKASMAMQEDMDMAVMETAEAAYGAAPVMNTIYDLGSAAAQKETMTEYQLEGKWNIKNEQEILCDIKTDSLSCRYHVVALPRLSDKAYLAAQIRTADVEDLQNTRAAVYLKGDFAGHVLLRPDMTKEHYDLSLGIDESLKIKRVQLKKHSSQQLLKGQKKTEYEYQIILSSQKDKTVTVKLGDQIPVSEEKAIVVEPAELSGGKLDTETGLISWELELPAGESRKLNLAWSVAWPKDKQTQEIEVEV